MTSSAADLKAAGNAHHAAGEHALAVAAYGRGLEVLGAADATELRAALHANRAAAHLALGDVDALALCVVDCDAVLALSLADEHSLSKKARHRRREADRQLQSARLRQEAEAHVAAGAWTAALGSCEQALRLQPEWDAKAMLKRLMGIALCATGRFAQAVAAFEQSLQVSPDGAEAADTLERLTKARRAVHACQTATAAATASSSTVGGQWGALPAAPDELLRLRIPYSTTARSSVTRVGSVGELQQDAAALRRAACLRASERRAREAAAAEAATGAGADTAADDAEAEEEVAEEDGTVAVLTLELEQLPVASSIGGKLWDASLLMSCFFAENASRLLPPQPPQLPQPHASSAADAASLLPRVLELGAGLGIVGLALGKLCPWLRLTLSDYDTAVLECARRNIARNRAASNQAAADGQLQMLDAQLLDFRDFTATSVAEAEAALARCELPQGPLAPYAAAGMLQTYDVVIGSDVVYEPSSAVLLAHVARAVLRRRPPAPGAFRPCAIFASPDSRPRLDEFVAAMCEAGLTCRIERVERGCAMMRRLRGARSGWGADTSFSFYFVELQEGAPLDLASTDK
tara:strand:+ start:1138 stop:2874 length:1737 start_codon:yes stop_codon:yes gene_type:complete